MAVSNNASLCGSTKILNSCCRYPIRLGHIPLCITESSPGHKLDRIFKNQYLTHCYQSLLNCEGSLFTFGVSFENDDHILNAIKSNKKIKTVYVGVQEDNQLPLQKIETVLKRKRVVGYNSTHTCPWGSPESSDNDE